MVISVLSMQLGCSARSNLGIHSEYGKASLSEGCSIFLPIIRGKQLWKERSASKSLRNSVCCIFYGRGCSSLLVQCSSKLDVTDRKKKSHRHRTVFHVLVGFSYVAADDMSMYAAERAKGVSRTAFVLCAISASGQLGSSREWSLCRISGRTAPTTQDLPVPRTSHVGRYTQLCGRSKELHDILYSIRSFSSTDERQLGVFPEKDRNNQVS